MGSALNPARLLPTRQPTLCRVRKPSTLGLDGGGHNGMAPGGGGGLSVGGFGGGLKDLWYFSTSWLVIASNSLSNFRTRSASSFSMSETHSRYRTFENVCRQTSTSEVSNLQTRGYSSSQTPGLIGFSNSNSWALFFRDRVTVWACPVGSPIKSSLPGVASVVRLSSQLLGLSVI